MLGRWGEVLVMWFCGILGVLLMLLAFLEAQDSMIREAVHSAMLGSISLAFAVILAATSRKAGRL